MASRDTPAIVTAADGITALEIREAEEKSVRAGAVVRGVTSEASKAPASWLSLGETRDSED